VAGRPKPALLVDGRPVEVDELLPVGAADDGPLAARTTPRPSAATCASPPPMTTRVPAASPVASAAPTPTTPIGVPGSTTGGSRSVRSPQRPASSGAQVRRARENSPVVHAFAGSAACSPLSLARIQSLIIPSVEAAS
jgi:hypothetical protein